MHCSRMQQHSYSSLSFLEDQIPLHKMCAAAHLNWQLNEPRTNFTMARVNGKKITSKIFYGQENLHKKVAKNRNQYQSEFYSIKLSFIADRGGTIYLNYYTQNVTWRIKWKS